MSRLNTLVCDKDNRQVATIDPSGLRSTTVYDAVNRPIPQVTPRGQRSTTVYDSCCSNPKVTIAPNGSRTSFTYNAAEYQTQPNLGRVLEVE